MEDKWFLNILPFIFTQVDYMLTKRDDAPYPKLNCTSKSQNTITQFPTLYLHELQPIEAGNDLVNDGVNAVISTMEVQVWSNVSETECKAILADAVLEMKRFGYSVTMFPDVRTNNKISWGAARFRRTIGAGDTISFT